MPRRATPRSNAWRWLAALWILAASAAGLALRARTEHWDPSIFFQVVFTFFGLAFSFLDRVSTPPEPRPSSLRVAILATIGVVLILSGALTVPAFAPFGVLFMVLVLSFGTEPQSRLFSRALLLLVVPIAAWAFFALRAEHARYQLFHVDPARIARVELTSPDGARTVTLESDADRRDFAALLASSLPLYPNHEGIRDAWAVRVVLHDGSAASFRLGRGSRSVRTTWIAFEPASDFHARATIEGVLYRFARDPAVVACEHAITEVCAAAERCNPGGPVNLFVPGEGGAGRVHYFDRHEDCVPSYVDRRCRTGVVCQSDETPRCVDLDAARFGVRRAATTPSACFDVFREDR